jgi:ribokinase
MTTPDLLILGQVTLDHVVPPTPGLWREQLGGNVLYAAAGARLWAPASRIGVVARVGAGLRDRVVAALRAAGIADGGLRPVDVPPMTEWLVYEGDGSRRNLPRDPALRETGADAAVLTTRYRERLAALSVTADEVPAAWLPARAIHIAPQVEVRHPANIAALAGTAALLTVDPSPHYARSRDPAGLFALLGPRILLPSTADIAPMAPHGDWPDALRRLIAAGFPEVALKLGADGALIATGAHPGGVSVPAEPVTVVDPTGAGDAFGGAYMASRALGHAPVAAAQRAVRAAARIVATAGVEAALALAPFG